MRIRLQLTLGSMGFALLGSLAAAQAQIPDAEIPLERRAVASQSSVPVLPELAALPQYLVDPFWPKPLPNNWISRSSPSASIASRYSRSHGF